MRVTKTTRNLGKPTQVLERTFFKIPQPTLSGEYQQKFTSTLSSPCHQLIRPGFVGTDELDLSGQAEGFELAFDGLEAAPQVGRDAGGAKLPAIAQQFQDPLTPTRWRVLDLSRIGVAFSGVPNRDPLGESVPSSTAGNDILPPANNPKLRLE